MRVHKFGGTSLAGGARIRAAAELVGRAGEPSVVVVSAMEGVTDLLAALATEAARGGVGDGGSRVGPGDPRLARLAEEHRKGARELARTSGVDTGAAPGLDDALERIDRILARLGGTLASLAAASDDGDRDRLTHEVLAAGEDLSVTLMALGLEGAGLVPEVVDARSVVRTEAPEGKVAVPRDEVAYELARARLLPLLDAGRTPVLQGFVGATADGRTTTLGRGGSDFTAALVGAALDAGEVTIWTDVDGIFSGDPRISPDVEILPEMGYEEAVELAYFGARVIHPAAAKHAVAREVSLVIRNSLRPDRPGTRIRCDLREAPGVAAVAHKGSVVLISVRCRPMFMAHGFLARVFGVLADHGLPVDLVATSHTSTAFTVDEDGDLSEVLDELREFAEVEVRRGLAVVSVVGRGLLQEPGIVARVLDLLEDEPVHLVSQASDVSLNLLVAEAAAPDVVRRIHGAITDRASGGEVPAASGRMPEGRAAG